MNTIDRQNNLDWLCIYSTYIQSYITLDWGKLTYIFKKKIEFTHEFNQKYSKVYFFKLLLGEPLGKKLTKAF